MLLMSRLNSPDDEVDEHAVLLQKTHLVASLTGEVPVLAQLPGFIRLLHHVTFLAEIGVFLCVFVIPVSADASDNSDQKKKDDDGLLVFGDKALAEG